ncbi:hypothetical protein J6590_006559 [Homalodisca vitripennis]|nr:hypothetical protein J6590_006559 [Homalodisca vitripennis]
MFNRATRQTPLRTPPSKDMNLEKNEHDQRGLKDELFIGLYNQRNNMLRRRRNYLDIGTALINETDVPPLPWQPTGSAALLPVKPRVQFASHQHRQQRHARIEAIMAWWTKTDVHRIKITGYV